MPVSAPRHRRGDLVLVALAFLVTLVAYLGTVAPGIVAEGDCSEYVAAAHVAGIPHAPGYPTYMGLAAGLARLVPAQALAGALNRMSAVLGAVTVALVALLALRLVRRVLPDAPGGVVRAAAALGALLLAGATEFWNQSLGAEVYTLACALLALCLERWSAGAAPRRWFGAALVTGLAFGVHYSVALPCGLLVVLGAWRERRALGSRGGLALLGLLLLGLGTFLYLPLRSRADPVLDFGDPQSPRAFARMLTLADMPTGKAFARPAEVLLGQLAAVARLAEHQWPLWVFALVLAGAVLVARRARGVALVLCGLVLLDYAGILAMANFALVDEEIYEVRFLFLPAYLAFALLSALGAAWLVLRVPARMRAAGALLGLVVVALLGFWVPGQARRLDRSHDRVMEEYGRALLACAEGPALLFTYGDNAWMPLAYLQVVEGERPDVIVLAAGLLTHPWYVRQVAERFPELVIDPAAPGVAAIARANVERWNLYHADPRPRGIEGFQEVPTGLLMRLVPDGAPVLPIVPPAPRFGPAYAELDLRERSVRADVLMAYARTGQWWRVAGRPSESERAYRVGLDVAAPEPRMPEFQHARAALWLGLGDLQAALGNTGPARESWMRALQEGPGTPPAELANRRLSPYDPAREAH